MPRRPLPRLMLMVALLALLYLNRGGLESARQTADTAESARVDNVAIATAFREGTSDLQVGGSGVVTRVLSDDSIGGRHQRFVLAVGPGHTVLFAHNIDLAPRVSGIEVGDSVEFYGEYEWNDRGGVIHWTHHDPGGRHPDGWLQHGGRRYQ